MKQSLTSKSWSLLRRFSKTIEWTIEVGLLMSRKAVLLLCVIGAGTLFQASRVGRVLSSIPTHSEAAVQHLLKVNSTSCPWEVDEACREGLEDQLSRIWPRKPNWSLAPNSSLLLVKVPKSASSTLAGIALRLQDHHAVHADWQHGQGIQYHERDEQSTFLVAPIRDPHGRAISSVYFHRFSFHNIRHPASSTVQLHMDDIPDNYITEYVRTRIGSDLLARVISIVQDYDFLLVFDRLEESIVLWSWLVNLPVSSFLLAAPSKLSGGWYKSGNKCIRLIRPKSHEDLRRSDRHVADQLLYSIANKSLQATIEFAGEEYLARWNEYNTLKRIVATTCAGNETRSPCNDDGQVSAAPNCYLRDFGCGYPCVDRVAAAN